MLIISSETFSSREQRLGKSRLQVAEAEPPSLHHSGVAFFLVPGYYVDCNQGGQTGWQDTVCASFISFVYLGCWHQGLNPEHSPEEKVPTRRAQEARQAVGPAFLSPSSYGDSGVDRGSSRHRVPTDYRVPKLYLCFSPETQTQFTLICILLETSNIKSILPRLSFVNLS